MKTSYKVKFWEIRPNKAGPKSSKAGKVISYTVRWTVGGEREIADVPAVDASEELPV